MKKLRLNNLMKKINNQFNWDDFNVESIEKKHEIRDKAKRDGMGDEPTTNTEGLSVTEGEIIQECTNYLEDHTTALRDYLKKTEEKQNQLSSHLKQNHFEPVVNKLDSDFHTLITEKEMKLRDLKSNYDTYKEEQKQFKRYHQLTREPNFADTGKTLKALGLIFFLFIVEVILNGFMLKGSLVGGTAEGVAVATSVSFLNVIASGLVGYYIFKKITHLEKAKKVLFGFFSFFFVVFIVYVNSCLGAYRSKAGEVFERQHGADATEANRLTGQEINDIMTSVIKPWGDDISFVFSGIILTFVGLTFAFISIMDGFTYNDTYPGFGNVGKKVNKYKDEIRKTFTSYAKEVSKIFSNSSHDLQKIFDDLRKNELTNWDTNTNLIQKEFVEYEQKANAVERKSNHIIAEYRKENIRVRKTDAPKYFKNKFTLLDEEKDPKKVFPDIAFHYMSDEEREKNKLAFDDNIDQKFKQAEKETEDLQKLSVEKQKELHEKFNTH